MEEISSTVTRRYMQLAACFAFIGRVTFGLPALSAYSVNLNVYDRLHKFGFAPGFNIRWVYGTLSMELLADYHHQSIMKLSVRWCV